MDGFQPNRWYSAIRESSNHEWVARRSAHVEALLWSRVKWVLVQILAVVATNEVRLLIFEVTQGSIATVFSYGLAGLKCFATAM